MKATRHHRALVTAAAAAVVAALCAAPAAAADTSADASREPASALGSHQRNLRFDMGLRSQLIKGAAFDPFDENDSFNQFTTSVSIAPWASGRFSLAAVLGYDYGGTSARARSDKASLDAHRFLLAPEARYHVLRVLALTARLGPTLTREHATLSGALDTELSSTAWRFGFDATAGAALELWGYASGASHRPRLWLTAEGGYGYTASNRLRLKASEAGQAPQRLVPVDLGDLSLGGPLFRITAALSFW